MSGERIVVGSVERSATSAEQNVIRTRCEPTRWKCHNIQCPLRIHKYMWPIFVWQQHSSSTTALLSLFLASARFKQTNELDFHVFNMMQANEIFRDSSKWTDLYMTVFGVALTSNTFRYNKDSCVWILLRPCTCICVKSSGDVSFAPV